MTHKLSISLWFCFYCFVFFFHVYRAHVSVGVFLPCVSCWHVCFSHYRILYHVYCVTNKFDLIWLIGHIGGSQRFFTALHGMQTRSSDEDSVCLFVRPSVKRVDCNKIKEKSIQIFIPYERTFSLVFWQKEWLVEGIPSTWNFVSTYPRWSEIAEFELIFARSASALKPSEKSSIDTNRKSHTRFPMSLRLSSYVAPKPPRGLKNAKRPFSSKIAPRLKKVCTSSIQILFPFVLFDYVDPPSLEFLARRGAELRIERIKAAVQWPLICVCQTRARAVRTVLTVATCMASCYSGRLCCYSKHHTALFIRE